MTTPTNSHKAWTDKRGHVSSVGRSRPSWIGLSIPQPLSIRVIWWAKRAEGFLNRHKDG